MWKGFGQAVVNRLMALINLTGIHLQQAETNPLPELREYYLKRAERNLRRIRRIKKLLV
jgi:hypothetical protein